MKKKGKWFIEEKTPEKKIEKENIRSMSQELFDKQM